MAHFAKLDDNNVVLDVNVVDNDALDSSNEEESGIAFLTEWSGGYSNWKQTSYNAATNGFRKNYAGKGYTYDLARDAFIPEQPFPSFTLDEETCRWEPPVPVPTDGKSYTWDENTLLWVEVTE